MKKFLIILVTLLTFNISTCLAQVQWYKTVSVAYKVKKYDNYYREYRWTNWSNWRKCVCEVKIDLNRDIIVIYSNETQIYKVLSIEAPPIDTSGKQVKFSVIDQDGDFGTLRLRVENNGNSQIYIDFADIMWVYNVVRTS